MKLKQALPDAKKLIKQKRKHHESLPYREVGAFIARFNQTQCSAVVKLLHEFTILNGNRAGEARGALWSEIDVSQRSLRFFFRRLGQRQTHEQLTIEEIERRDHNKMQSHIDETLYPPRLAYERMQPDNGVVRKHAWLERKQFAVFRKQLPSGNEGIIEHEGIAERRQIQAENEQQQNR